MVNDRSGGLYAPSLVEVTTRQLREEILSGLLVPGERLIEEQIRLRFSISRAPLREALRSLAQQGLVEHLPRRGMRVTNLTDIDVDQLFGIRRALERHAIESSFPGRFRRATTSWPRSATGWSRCVRPMPTMISSGRTMRIGRSTPPS